MALMEYLKNNKKDTDGWLRKSAKEKMNRKKVIVIKYYSSGLMDCACCGEKLLEFLTIDHLNEDGAEHKRKNRIKSMYDWLIKHDFPFGFQVLCYNCNIGKYLFGVHKYNL